MPAYASLKNGVYKPGHFSEDEMWSAFAYLFSSKSKNSASYKFGFLKAILDNLYNVDENLTLTFDTLFSKFAEIYWNLVLKYHLRQSPVSNRGARTMLEQALWTTKEHYLIAEDVPFESLTPEMNLYVCQKVKQGCKNNVVGALYGDLQEMFYSFDVREGWIKLNPEMYAFVCKHKVAIEKLNYYEWARYLEKINADDVMDHLLTKIDESSKRSNLNYYRDILFEEFENRCFYCGRRITSNSVHVDHFIPWSFIKDDKLWNFVLACPACNESKRDRLAPEANLNLLINRNQQLLELRPDIVQMRNYQAVRLRNIYYWAQNNGYNNIWTPPAQEIVHGE